MSFIALLIAAVLTIVIETLFLILVYRFRGYQILVAVLMNLGTNLLLNLMLGLYDVLFVPFELEFIIATIIGEGCVFLIEWLAYYPILGKKRGLLASLFANLISFSLGLLLLWLLSPLFPF